jgi:hypothetical protein
MADRLEQPPDAETVGGADHAAAMDTVTRALGIPAALLEEAIVEARAVGRHRVRAVPARRIDELVSEIADTTGARGTD